MGSDIKTYISLFSNAGIGCYGFQQAGFSCIATNEIIPRRIEIQKINRKCKYETGYICGDITHQSIKTTIYQQVELWKSKEGIEEVDVVIATPPCQGMSVANHKKRNELPRNSLVVEALNIICKINPKFFVLENVRSFLRTLCIDNDGLAKPIQKAIEINLANYNILDRVINFKDYGCPSQRTRALVVGVRKDLPDISPFDVFPNCEKAQTVRETIGHLNRLNVMGSIDPEDIYHNFRPYPQHMLNWINKLKEGESAFDQHDQTRVPHQIINGKIVINTNKNHDKYKRCYWDKPGCCVHTRNDQLASQMTIHPSDNRVFSIRELMLLMSIPREFQWTNTPLSELNKMNLIDKQRHLKAEEMKIRQAIGEAVPTVIFRKIANRIGMYSERKMLSKPEIYKIISTQQLTCSSNLSQFIKKNTHKYSYQELSKIAEYANSKRFHNAAFYTSKDICYSVVKDLPNFENKKIIRILEPSVGLGNFIPLLAEKYKDVETVIIDVLDVDPDTIGILKILIKKIPLPRNVKINILSEDFLSSKFCGGQDDQKYDIVVGNPPFKKIVNNRTLLTQYKKQAYNKETNNTIAFFIEKAIRLGKYISLIAPKSLLSAPEFNKTRELISKNRITRICDYGEEAFDIKIETICVQVETETSIRRDTERLIKVESIIEKNIRYVPQEYICDPEYPYWLIYRNNYFDRVCQKLVFGIFIVRRDRQITNRLLTKSGKYRVLKSRNIGNNRIINISGYDRYIQSLNNVYIGKVINQRAVLIPNLTYNPRACFLPKNCIADGSVAFAIPKNGYVVTASDLKYYSTKEFKEFYRIARNRSSRSMNIDSNSIYFFGLPRKHMSYER